MTHEEIQKAVNEISKMLTDRGIGHHTCSIDIKANVSPCFYIGCYDRIFGGLNSKFIRGETPQDVFEETKAFVMALPNKKDLNKQSFMAELATVIDKGKDLGIDVEFLNPLVEQMRSLSENIITDTRGQ